MKVVTIETIDLAKQMENEDFRDSFFQWDVHEKKKTASAKIAVEEAIKQGEILNRIKDKHGRPGFLAFCRGKNLTERQGYYYISFFENRDNDFFRELSFSQATRFLPIVKDEGVVSDSEGLTLPDGTRLNIADIRNMSVKEVDLFVKQYRRVKDEKATQVGEIQKNHKEEIEKIRNDYAELEDEKRKIEKERDMLLAREGKHPLDAEIDDIDRWAMAMGTRIARLMNDKEKFARLEQSQVLLEKLNGVFIYLVDVAQGQSAKLQDLI